MKSQQDNSIEPERQSLDRRPQQISPVESITEFKRNSSQLPIHSIHVDSTFEVIKHGDKAND